MTIDTYKWPIENLLSQARNCYRKEGQEAAWPAEEPGVEAALNKFQEVLGRQHKRYQADRTIGAGGSGIVLRLQDTMFPAAPKALKFPRPVPGQIGMLADLLGKEIATLASLRHPGVVAVHYYSEYNEVGPYSLLPFYIMDFVRGETSNEYMARTETNEEDLIRIALESAQTFDHLHSLLPSPLAHLDIKDKNIQITEDGRPVLIDLGTCKALSDDERTTQLACTKQRAHPGLVELLDRDPSDNNRVRGEVRRKDLKREYDLYAFALMILDWMGLEPRASTLEPKNIYSRLEPYTRKYLLLLVGRLTVDNPPAWLEKDIGLSKAFLQRFPIASFGEVADLIERLYPGRGPVNSLSELAPSSLSSIQAGPGTHVPLTPGLIEVLDSPLFRRLGAITQLGLVSQVYPGAKHTRREHSLGTYSNTRKLLRALYQDPYSPLFRQLITKQDCRDVLLLSLLHDLGQFPLAHDLEEIDDGVFDHVDLTRAMLRGEWKKAGVSPVSFSSLDAVFAAWGTSPENLIEILDAKATSTTAHPRHKLLRSLISGPVDADKLDYLFRDARHTDVTYPRGIDVDRLLRCLTTVVLRRAGRAYEVPAVAVHSKGKVSAEFMTMARYAMFSQVYWHHAVRAQKSMLGRSVQALLASLRGTSLVQFRRELVELVKELPTSTGIRSAPGPGPLFSTRTEGTDISPGDLVVLEWLWKRLDELSLPEADLIERIINRKLFKRLWVVSYEMDKPLWERLMKLWDPLDRATRYEMSRRIEAEISKAVAGKVLPVTTMKAEVAEDKIISFTAAKIPWLLLDLPGNRVGSEVPLSYVLEGQRRSLRKDDSAVGPVAESPAWLQYAQQLREAAGKMRVFCHPDLVDSVEASVPWETGFEHIEGALTRSPRGEFS